MDSASARRLVGIRSEVSRWNPMLGNLFQLQEKWNYIAKSYVKPGDRILQLQSHSQSLDVREHCAHNKITMSMRLSPSSTLLVNAMDFEELL